MERVRWRVVGMHCSACVARITRALSRLDGVKSVDARLAKSEVEVAFDPTQQNADNIKALLTSLGYDVSARRLPNLLPVVLGMALFWLLSSARAGRTFLPQMSYTSSFGLIFLFGVLTSLHCAAMCGGFVFSQGFDQKNAVLYHIARVISYTTVGAIAGAVGSVIGPTGSWRGSVAIAAGFLMILMALKMVGLVRMPVPHWLAPRLPKGSVFAGALTGLMPCGPLNTMQIYALASGSALRGGLTLFFFVLGTLPLMGLISLLGSVIGDKMNARVARLSAAVLIGMGLLMGSQGLALSGIPVRLNFERPVTATVTDGKQFINMTADFGSYSPGTFIIRSGVPVEWHINVKNLDDCITPILVPGLKIRQELVPGANVISFTPTKDGDLVFTCWMGMVNGVFKVKS